MNLVDSALSTVIDSLGRHDAVVICGAGISLDPPAGLPDWHELRDSTIRAVARRGPGLDHHVRTLTAMEMLALPGKFGMSPELVASTVRRHCPGYFAAFAALEDEEPNTNHLWLAAAAGTGAVSVIVTTNFDVFIERALDAAAVPFIAYRTAAEFAAFDPDVAAVHLLKLHGCITAPDTIVATVEQEALGLVGEKIAVLDRVLPGQWQIFWGYSGADLKIDVDYLRGITNRDAAAGLVWSLFASGDYAEAPNAFVRRLVGEYGDRGILGHNLLPRGFAGVTRPTLALPADVVSDEERFALQEKKNQQLRGALAAWADSEVDALTALQIFAELLVMAGEWEGALDCAEHVESLGAEREDPGMALVAVDLSRTSLLSLGRGAEAMDAALRMQELARELGDARRLASALTFEAGMHASVGETAVALERFGQASLILSDFGDHRELAHVQIEMGKLERDRGRFEPAMSLYEEAGTAARKIGALRIEAEALTGQADLLLKWGEPDQAETAIDRAREAAITYGDRGLLGQAVFQEGTLRLIRGDFDGARPVLEDALHHLEIANQTSLTGYVLDSLAKVALFSGDREGARRLQDRVVEIVRTDGGPRRLGQSLLSAADVSDDGVERRSMLEEALALLSSANDSFTAALAASRLARIEHAAGELDSAERHLQQAMALYRRAETYDFLTDPLRAIAVIRAERSGQEGWTLGPVVLDAMRTAHISEETIGALLDDSGIGPGGDVRARLGQAPDAESSMLAILVAVKRVTTERLEARDFEAIVQWSSFAVQLAGAVGDMWAAGVFLNDAGMSYSNLGAREKAVSLLSASRECARTLADADEATLRALNLAIEHTRAGHVEVALGTLREEEPALPRVLDRPIRLERELRFAIKYDELRAWDDAGRVFTLVRDDARLAGDLAALGRAHQGRGKAMRELGQPARAGDERQLASRVYERAGEVDAAALMALLAGVCFKMVPERQADAREALIRAVDLAEQSELQDVQMTARAHLASLVG
jgi:tetratricopeptide (TPR) repeat protein